MSHILLLICLKGAIGNSGRAGLAARPTNLPTEHRRFHTRNGQALVSKYPLQLFENGITTATCLIK
jgi:hypothetical protein